MIEIITREQWGAIHANGFHTRAVGDLEKWLHHSVTAQLPKTASMRDEVKQMRILEDIGEQRFGGGISYSFPIFPSGRIYEGVSIDRVGAHTAGHNTIGAAICLVGNYEEHEPTQEQIDAVIRLLEHGVIQGWWKDSMLDGGHRDLKATACPGKFAYKKISVINHVKNLLVKPSTPKPINQPVKPAKSVQQMASEVIAGKHGNGHEQRRKSLGVDAKTYELVRTEVNRRLL